MYRHGNRIFLFPRILPRGRYHREWQTSNASLLSLAMFLFTAAELGSFRELATYFIDFLFQTFHGSSIKNERIFKYSRYDELARALKGVVFD